MSIEVPTAAAVREALAGLTIKQINLLAVASGVPPRTIYKIKCGETADPRMDTVSKFWPHISAARVESHAARRA